MKTETSGPNGDIFRGAGKNAKASISRARLNELVSQAQQLKHARETNRRLNRRCQAAESELRRHQRQLQSIFNQFQYQTDILWARSWAVREATRELRAATNDLGPVVRNAFIWGMATGTFLVLTIISFGRYLI